MCPHHCDFTTDRQLIHSSHVVVFSERDLETVTLVNGKDSTIRIPANVPNPRIPSQYWALLLLESPVHTKGAISSFESFFNWTISFRKSSDIYAPYGLVEARENQTHFDDDPGSQSFSNKSKLIAWINSYCGSTNQRHKLVQKLQSYLQVDIYGQCGPFKCSKDNSNICEDLQHCYDEIGKDYKFYLAFENSLCEDYVTEKLFNALRADMVPVVYGGANYADHLPSHSYINVRDFDSVQQLANYLVYLDKNPSEYLKYFQWKENYVVAPDIFYLERTWCSLCERISLESNVSQVSIVSKLSEWWNFQNGSSACVQPPLLVD